MFIQKSFNFLNQLKENNNKEWFNTNKSKYQEGKTEFEHFTSLLIKGIKTFDPELDIINPKDTLFRIYRDVRFSKDKSPYKTNFGAHIVKGGKKSGNAGYYFHLEPGGSFAGGGIYCPMPEILKKVRREIYNNPEEFKSIINSKEFRKSFGLIHGEKLKTVPQGFPKEFPDIDLLRYKSYTVIREFPDELILSDRIIKEAIKSFQLMFPFNSFINFALYGYL